MFVYFYCFGDNTAIRRNIYPQGVLFQQGEFNGLLHCICNWSSSDLVQWVMQLRDEQTFGIPGWLSLTFKWGLIQAPYIFPQKRLPMEILLASFKDREVNATACRKGLPWWLCYPREPSLYTQGGNGTGELKKNLWNRVQKVSLGSQSKTKSFKQGDVQIRFIRLMRDNYAQIYSNKQNNQDKTALTVCLFNFLNSILLHLFHICSVLLLSILCLLTFFAYASAQVSPLYFLFCIPSYVTHFWGCEWHH